MDGYRYLSYADGDFPQTETAAKEIFSLPIYPSLTDDVQTRVIKALKTLKKN